MKEFVYGWTAWAFCEVAFNWRDWKVVENDEDGFLYKAYWCIPHHCYNIGNALYGKAYNL